MKFLLVSLAVAIAKAAGWTLPCSSSLVTTTTTSRNSLSPLFVSTGNIGLGPGKDQQESITSKEWVEGVDYEVPDHEAYRTSRRSKLDEQCDAWFGTLLNSNDNDNDNTKNGILGTLSDKARQILTTPVVLKNDLPKPNRDDEDWTPYVSTKLPWTPLVPAFGLEQYGLPIPRRNAETWRHFDVVGMVQTDYSRVVEHLGEF
jgi:hypothetical protein